MEQDYDLEEDYAPRYLWGRLAFFLLALILAFAVGRCTKSDGVAENTYRAEQQKVIELESDNAVLQQQLDAATAGQADGDGGGNGGGGGGKDDDSDGGDGDDDDAGDEADDGGVAEGQTYTVQSGDTLTTIAQKFYGQQSRFDLIVDANNLSDDTPLRVGQELVIPPEP